MIGTFQRQHQARPSLFPPAGPVGRTRSPAPFADRTDPSPADRVPAADPHPRRRIAHPRHDPRSRREGVSSDGLPTGSRRHDDELRFIKLLWSAAKFSGQHHILALTCPEDSHSLEAFERLGVESCLFIGAQELLGRLDRLARLGESNRRHQPAEEAGTPARPPEGWRLDGPEVRLAPREWTEMPAEIDPSLRPDRTGLRQGIPRHRIEPAAPRASRPDRPPLRASRGTRGGVGRHPPEQWMGDPPPGHPVEAPPRPPRQPSRARLEPGDAIRQGLRDARGPDGPGQGRGQGPAEDPGPRRPACIGRRPRPHPGGRRAGRGGAGPAHGDGRRRRLRAQRARRRPAMPRVGRALRVHRPTP